MNEQNGEIEAADRQPEPADIDPPTGTTKQEQPNNEANPNEQVSPYSYKGFFDYLRKLRDAGPDRHIELLLTIAIATFAFLQFTITRDNDRTATKTQVLLNSPLITPFDPRVEWNNTGTGPGVFIRDDFQNVGETKAIGTEVSIGWGYSPPTENSKYQVVDTNWAKTAWPRDAIRKWASAPIPLSEVLKWKSGISSRPLYFYEKVWYNDVFPLDEGAHPRNDHLFEACIQVNHIEDDAANGGRNTRWGFIPCARKDCIDENCGADYAKAYK
jgi:hypothetical protein